MSLKTEKVIEFYKIIKTKDAGEEKTLLSKQTFDPSHLPLTFKLPSGCNYFECYSLIYGEISVGGKKVDMCSDKLNFKQYDFSVAEKEDCPKEIYAAVCLKSLPVYKIGNIDEVQTVHNIGYGNQVHGDFVGSFDYVQHPKTLNLNDVVVRDGYNRFELFDTLTTTLGSNQGDVKLYSQQKLNHSVYYIGRLEEVMADTKTVVAHTQDGLRIVCERGELIDPNNIDKFGRIVFEPISPDM